MATLELKTLRCIRKNDVSGLDEPRIKVDGDLVWTWYEVDFEVR